MLFIFQWQSRSRGEPADAPYYLWGGGRRGDDLQLKSQISQVVAQGSIWIYCYWPFSFKENLFNTRSKLSIQVNTADSCYSHCFEPRWKTFSYWWHFPSLDEEALHRLGKHQWGFIQVLKLFSFPPKASLCPQSGGSVWVSKPYPLLHQKRVSSAGHGDAFFGYATNSSWGGRRP